MADALDADELAAYFALRHAGDRLQRVVTQQLREFSLTEVQFSVLATLLAQDGRRMSDLADALVVSRSGLTYQVTQLERRNLVAREDHGADERSVVARLTAEGRRLIGQVLPGHVALVRAEFLDLLDPKERQVVADALGRVAARPEG